MLAAKTINPVSRLLEGWGFGSPGRRGWRDYRPGLGLPPLGTGLGAFLHLSFLRQRDIDERHFQSGARLQAIR